MAVQLFANRYEIVDRLGSGGFGEVYRARDLHLNNMEIALKLYKPQNGLDPAIFEASILTLLEGPHVLKIRNADIYQDVPYIATDIAPGGSADLRSRPNGVLPALAILWVRHLLIGLGVCHAAGLIHRDVKAANLFLNNDDEGLLGDPGVAAHADQDATADVHGTLSCRAPELWVGGRCSASSDIYAAGLCLYQLFSGQNPYDALPTFDAVRDAVIGRQLPPLRDLAPHVPRALATRVQKAMAFDPADRYPSATSFHDALADLPKLRWGWRRVLPHPGHAACWTADQLQGGLGRTVCAIGGPAEFEIEMRKFGGTNARVLAHCHQGVQRARLMVVLRKLFDRHM